MTKIVIKPDNISFDVESNETILDAALKQNLNLPHGCKSGTCGACKCKVISGDLRLEPYNKTVLSDYDKNQGYTLLCKAHPDSNAELYIPGLLDNFPIKIMPAKVVSIVKQNSIAIIKFKTPQVQKFGFFAGQYIDIILNGKNRSYSIANCYKADNEIEVHVKYHKDGVFSEFVWNILKENDVLRFKGPLGNFKLQKSNKPLILVCTGTGFAPIKSILEELVLSNSSREIYFYWGNRFYQDFYLIGQIIDNKKSLNLKESMCLSREEYDGFYNGRVTNKIKNDFSDLSNFEVYACGNMKMIEDVYEICTQDLNLNKEFFYSDAFTPSV
jgi:CDP-4-dehydro-6-deoxyglucose reductase